MQNGRLKAQAEAAVKAKTKACTLETQVTHYKKKYETAQLRVKQPETKANDESHTKAEGFRVQAAQYQVRNLEVKLETVENALCDQIAALKAAKMEQGKDREAHWNELKKIEANNSEVAKAHRLTVEELKSLKNVVLEVTDEWECMTEASCGKAGKKMEDLRAALE